LARRQYLQGMGKSPVKQRQLHNPSRRRFLKHTSALGIAGLAGTSFPSLVTHAAGAHRPRFNNPRIAIVGAGLAGLNAAFQLKKAGYTTSLFEARQRIGGRIFSRRGVVGEDLVVEMGGEFINSDHTDMLDLAQELGLNLFDRQADAATIDVAGSAFYFDNKSWTEQELAPLLEPLVIQINTDAELLDQDWDTYAPYFDELSVADYLDQYENLIPQAFVRTLIENAIRTEYGAEASNSSALQLLFLLPVVDGEQVELLGYSDELYTVEGGNAKITSAMAEILEGDIRLGKTLVELEYQKNGKYELSFADGSEYRADYVILALPFSTLRKVELSLDLPDDLRDFIQQVDLGHNEKLLAGYRHRAWREAPGFSLEAWTDLGFSEVWDGSQRQSDKEYGALTYYTGGKEVWPIVGQNIDDNTLGAAFSKKLAQFVPDLDKIAIAYRSTQWTRNAYTRGAYVNYRPGQLTRFGDYFWIESENADESQSVSVDNVIFAGEHLSDEFYGFMNGAAQTGRLAANLLMSMLEG